MKWLNWFKDKNKIKNISTDSNLANIYQDEISGTNPYTHKIKGNVTIADIVLLWWYSVVKNPSIKPGYFEYRYGIDAKKRTLFLEENGYLSEADPDTYLKQQTNNKLKDILKRHKLKVSGKKIELIQRILDNLTDSELRVLLPNTSLMPSENGYKLLKEFSYITYGHKHFDGWVTPINMYDKYQEMHKLTSTYYLPGDISFSIYQDVYDNAVKKGQDGLLRNVEYRRSEQLLREGKVKDALVHLLAVIIYDACINEPVDIIDNLLKKSKSLVDDYIIEESEYRELLNHGVRHIFTTHPIGENQLGDIENILIEFHYKSNLKYEKLKKEFIEKYAD